MHGCIYILRLYSFSSHFTVKTNTLLVEFWQEYRKENTPEITDDDVLTIGDHTKNERLIELYKQEYDKLHNGESITDNKHFECVCFQ